MFSVLEAVGPDRRINLGGGAFAVKLVAADSISTKTQAGTWRPCTDGDVASIQPDGALQGREAEAIGPWETFHDDSGRTTITVGGRTFILAPTAQ